jgi:hypothetical protein
MPFIAKFTLDRLAGPLSHTASDDSPGCTMGRFAFLVTAAVLATGSAASAQMFTPLPNSCQKLSSSAGSGSGDNPAIYLRAACVAARAGTTSPTDGRLTREELMSILMLMGLQQTPRSHVS